MSTSYNFNLLLSVLALDISHAHTMNIILVQYIQYMTRSTDIFSINEFLILSNCMCCFLIKTSDLSQSRAHFTLYYFEPHSKVSPPPPRTGYFFILVVKVPPPPLGISLCFASVGKNRILRPQILRHSTKKLEVFSKTLSL